MITKWATIASITAREESAHKQRRWFYVGIDQWKYQYQASYLDTYADTSCICVYR